MTIATYVLKVASRCNMDCSYCYVYRAADSSWRRQPAAMTEPVARAAAARIRAECERTGLESVNVNLHGGEPLLIGLPKLDAILEAIRDVFAGSGIRVDSALQTNGLLLNEAAIAWLADRNVGLYVSLDGPPAVNDRHRIDRRGAPTARRVEDRLAALLASGHHDRIFQGFLAVIDAGSDPVAVFDHLARYRPPAIDFLLPLTNHDGLDKQTHADWLIGCFDHWFDGDSGIIVRTFQRIIARLVLPGATSGAAGVPVEALVVETDGAWEIDDTLKTAFDGASHLGLDVHGHSVAEVTASSAFRLWERRSQPPRICRDCDVFAVCQGWHASQRYSQERGYDNPNVHCEDLQRLIAHVADRVHRQFLHLASPDSGTRVGAARS